MLSASELRSTAASIGEAQLPGGMIPWFAGGHADVWNMVEAAMALATAGFTYEAGRAYQWLADAQDAGGAWHHYYVAGGVEEARRDTNCCAYIATGVWHHHLVTGDPGFLEAMWPVVEAALAFVLDHERPGGEILWCREADGSPGRFALLTGCSSIYFSLRCAIAAAEHQGMERPDWELAAGRLAHAVAFRPDCFEPKDRWAMDWYYPVLAGVLTAPAGRARLRERWSEFVLEGRGVRCVADRPWVTAAETAELVMALEAVGCTDEARSLFAWAQQLRHHDGSYWTGCVYPEAKHFPGGERSSYTAAAMILAADVLAGPAGSPASGLFRGEGLPRSASLDLDLDAVDAVAERSDRH